MDLDSTTRTGKTGTDTPPPAWTSVIAARRRGQVLPTEGPRTLFPEIEELLARPSGH
jgi:hypothetical protein